VVAVPVVALIAASPSCGGEAGRANPPRPASAAAPHAPADGGADAPRPALAVASAPRDAGAEQPKGAGESCASLAELGTGLGTGKEGQGGAADVKRAFEACQRDCDRKELGACRALASYYLSGSPGVVDQNAAKAAQVLDHACKAGHAGSCVDLATLYEEGKGVKRNPKKAARLRTKAEVFEGIE
jgi:TPR repeat protein